MNLVPITREKRAIEILYDLLKERTPEQSISHKVMPTIEEHAEFVRSHPYLCWYLLLDDDYVGSVYLSKQREIGVFIFKGHQGKGFATEGVRMLMERWPGKFLANVAPTNPASRRFFEKFGFRHIQDTLER